MTGDALSLSNVRFYDNRQPSEFDFVRIQPGRSLTFFNSRKRPPKDESLKNLEKRGDYNGNMSRATSSKVKKMLKLWMAAMQVGLDHADKTYGNKRRCPWYPRFITLTLPAEQYHTDQEIRRKFLDRFIKQLQRKAQVRYYFWKRSPKEWQYSFPSYCRSVHSQGSGAKVVGAYPAAIYRAVSDEAQNIRSATMQ